MKRASPVQLRQSLEVANGLVRAGVRFVCVPVIDEADAMNLAGQAAQRLERLAYIAEAQEKRT
ncbi:DUF1382 family protein [Pseudomonas sp. SWRI102]|uniref:DUF1382 family protein n=1 Tax=Pseudomonas marvdashtae TaxID=2745500 RepID=A0A923JPZ6_9PSED|nr:DUF1382 family protein [Pseudomonas marvdashtae]MBV4553079.1 DUF1382 family protein [Pseudomonas marvdashtae]